MTGQEVLTVSVSVGLAALVSAVGWLLRGMINKIWGTFESRISDVELWKKEIDKKGGVITRDDHFAFCGKARAECREEWCGRVGEIYNWRDSMFKEGGPVMVKEHIAICAKVTEKVVRDCQERADKNIESVRELVNSQLELIKATLHNDVLEGINSIKEYVNSQNEKKK
jgi:hypothetical protein